MRAVGGGWQCGRAASVHVKKKKVAEFVNFGANSTISELSEKSGVLAALVLAASGTHASCVLSTRQLHALFCSHRAKQPLTATCLDKANTLCRSTKASSGLGNSTPAAVTGPPCLFRVSLTAYERDAIWCHHPQIMAASSFPSLSRGLSSPTLRRPSWTTLYRDLHLARAAALIMRVYSPRMRIRTRSSHDRLRIVSSSVI